MLVCASWAASDVSARDHTAAQQLPDVAVTRAGVSPCVVHHRQYMCRSERLVLLS